MSRPATGQVIERRGKRGRTYALRFRAYGHRHYLTLDVTTHAEAEAELANVLADVRRGIWQPPKPPPVVESKPEPTFHEFASEWYASKEAEGLRPRTLEDYKWALTHHLLPFFKSHRLTEITVREVDRYKLAKAGEGVLAAAQVNKTLTRLSQILGLAVEYELIPANPAAGKRRRLKAVKPRRAWVEPEQLPILLESAESPKLHLLGGRGRPLLALLAGTGLRISEALALQRRDVNLARGTLSVGEAKTDAGVRVVDLTPALRDELAVWLDRSPFKKPTDLAFPTSNGKPDNRNNVRRRLLVKAIERANKRLAELGMEPIGKVSPHGLRRTYASLRCAVGDDVAYTAAQLGHEDPTFTLKTYTHAVKRRDRLTTAELEQFERAVEWAQWARMGTNGGNGDLAAAEQSVPEEEKAPR
jgi:integrase